ncbi:copper homeostasis periplasmic binding protein CopC [Paenibacillus sp. HGF5]|uniref:copper homeostasis periplasmic binding protein CopC n=1 Tax=Paenibacillus sp. HGF5 TaxID=908341 RepID=UPI000207223E|nr:copper homeostasis periplasmic binding protein CopC [Paenibacillus sp. HGF5]EGG38489.1 copper resistance protein CopC [Paenibacillus sp. HGF5]
MLKHVKTSVLLTLGLLLVLVFPTATWAHSKLESSTPAADAKITESVKEVNLSFNENIDENLSTLKVKNAQGEAVEVSEVKVNQNTMAGTLAAPLPSGSYTVEWKIVGGDGHPVDGTYAFEVDAPEAEAAPETPADTEETPVDTGNTPDETAPADDTAAGNADQTADTNQQTENTPANDTSEGNGSTVWIVIIVIVAVVAGYFGIKASRKRK